LVNSTAPCIEGSVGTALKILVDVLAYRLKRLEMANLAAAVAVMLALRLPFGELAARAAYAFVLNVLAYTTNDYYDVERDLLSGRDADKSRYLAEHRKQALFAQLALAALLLAVALAWRPELLVAAVAGAGICWLYSARLKAVAYADVVAMTLWGVAMPLVAVPLGSLLGWALVVELGLFSTSFETIQTIRDLDQDRAAGLETTAVRLGRERTLLLARLSMVVSSAYAVLLLHKFIGLGLLLAALLPFRADDPSRYWTRVRMVIGLVWLAIIGFIYFTGSTDGVLALETPAR
jgi:4-hydroxybenzoate polyprenyltransferase